LINYLINLYKDFVRTHKEESASRPIG